MKPTPLLPMLLLTVTTALASSPWPVPIAGNAFHTYPEAGSVEWPTEGPLSWEGSNEVFSVFFHLNQPATLHLSLRAHVPEGQSTLLTRVLGLAFTNLLQDSAPSIYPIGQVRVPQPGYVRVDFQGTRRTGARFAALQDLLVTPNPANTSLDFVKTNQGNMFYWGRRGPSVHLGYQTPRDLQLQYAYSEITVPHGQDPVGSYFMANGFAEGYFGIQVNSPTERRVLFSVWSPYSTDDPNAIPADQRVEALARGPDVRIGEFGNEGSGGQSFLRHPWKAGTTYRFLTEVKPDGQGRTLYSAWFGDKAANEWRLIATFRRPKTDTHLRGFHSFLENFNPATGHIGRRALHGNVWVCDTAGQWHEILQARFTVDPTGRGRHRLDFTGGIEGRHFFLRNCGFFNETGTPGEVFTRQSSTADRPVIRFDTLPRR